MRLFAILAGILLLAGCTSLRDARGPSEICEVHHTFMRAVEVPGPAGQLAVTRDFVEASNRLFPHAYLDYAPDERHRLVIYVCDECVKAKSDWLRQHAADAPVRR